MSHPVVSIIMPVHNTENFIEKSLLSLQNQTLKNIEIICINDASTDNSEQIIQSFMKNDDRIKLANIPTQSGSSTARNHGLKASTGQYIMFCDSDDWYEAEMCELMVSTIEAKNVDLVMCDANVIHQDPSRGAGAAYYHKLNTFGFYKLNQKIKSEIRPLIWNKIFKKSFIDQYHIKFPEGTNGGDYGFLIQYLAVSLSAFGLDKSLYNYLLREGSVVSNVLIQKSQTTLNRIKNYNYIYHFLIDNRLMEANASYFAEAMWHEINWLISTHKDKTFLGAMVDIGKEVMQDFDMDYIPDALPEKKMLNAIKNKKFDFLCSHYKIEQNQTKQNQIEQKEPFHGDEITRVKILGLNIMKIKKSKKYT